ncbi:hypothetical protein A5740_10935 [Mycobacterium sp. GA-1841]|uniref:hypothetical protein n=1 Tax=Mycobacterium sp. GA-1841 TaxID=1834154 RepID=UPI00096FEADE|nr:hypothetical protein [Mycobacterium sp. GA-1841]OMC34141.1 hypothetical protein A5740_10935 [Mycobacterium sp. GA-1841]
MNGSPPRVPSDGPIPAELLADLQAGLLDDATAAQVRRRVRTDPQAGPEARAILSALDRVRRDVRALGADPASAPPVPEDVSARLSEALRAAPGPPARRWKLLAALAGVSAAVVAIVVGSVMLLRAPATTTSTLTSLGQISVSPPRTAIDLPDSQVLGLLSAPSDFGPLTDPQHRAACLQALGYPPDVQILGARRHGMGGQPGVLMLLPAADQPTADAVIALVVAADCDGSQAGLLARTVINRPVRSP